MSLTVLVTRNVEDRYRGFLSSVMLEISAGVYISPQINKAARERIWAVMSDWYAHLGQGTLLMTWTDRELPGGVGLLVLGEPIRDLVPVDGLLLVRR